MRAKKKAKRSVKATEKNPPKKPVGRGKLPSHLTPGNPGNSGGKPGRSGRPKTSYREFCRTVLTQPHVEQAVQIAAARWDNPGFAALHKHLADRAFGPVEKRVRLDANVSMSFAEDLKQARARLEAEGL